MCTWWDCKTVLFAPCNVWSSVILYPLLLYSCVQGVIVALYYLGFGGGLFRAVHVSLNSMNNHCTLIFEIALTSAVHYIHGPFSLVVLQ